MSSYTRKAEPCNLMSSCVVPAELRLVLRARVVSCLEGQDHHGYVQVPSRHLNPAGFCFVGLRLEHVWSSLILTSSVIADLSVQSWRVDSSQVKTCPA